MNLDAQIESVLFWKGEPVSIKRLASILEKTEDEIASSVALLEEKLKDRGVTLMHKDGEVMLATSKGTSVLIEKLTKEELVRDLGKAGLETLSIVIYQGPISRREIDHIRGVNSNFILRNLLIRGLVEKIPSPTDQRSFLYKPTFELMSYLGIRKVEEMPEFESVKKEIEAFARASEEGRKKPEENVIE